MEAHAGHGALGARAEVRIAQALEGERALGEHAAPALAQQPARGVQQPLYAPVLSRFVLVGRGVRPRAPRAL